MNITRDEEIKMLRLKISKLENEQKAEDLITFRNKLIAYLKDVLTMVTKWGITYVDIEDKRGALCSYCHLKLCENCPMEGICDKCAGDTLKDITPEKIEIAIKKLEEEMR